MRQSLILGLVAILFVAPAVAGTSTITLDSTVGGSPTAGTGTARITSTRNYEIFEVRARTGIRDGSTLVVSVEIEDRDGYRDWYDVATMTVRLGGAYVALDNREDFSVAFPVEYILGVRVSIGDRMLLEGSFESPVR